MNLPNVEKELTRKCVDVLLDLESKRESRLITESAFQLAIMSVYNVVSGLTNNLEFDVAKAIQEMDLNVSIDNSFTRSLFFADEKKCLMVRFDKDFTSAVIRKVEIEKQGKIVRGEDESVADFIERVESGIVKTAKRLNYKDVV